MADSNEIIRLMRHAADRLEQEDVAAIAMHVPGWSSEKKAVVEQAISADMAITYAVAVLRLVASFLSDVEIGEQAAAVIHPNPSSGGAS